MKATPAQQKELLRLQDLDTRIERIDHSLGRLPHDQKLVELRTAADAVRRSVADARGAAEDAKARLARIESDVAVVLQRLARDEDRAAGSSSMKDVEALQGEIDSLKRRRETLEDAQLEVMEELDIAERSLDAVVAQLADHERAIGEVAAERQEAIDTLQRERSGIEADRSLIADGVDGALLALYEKQRHRYGIGAALLEHGVNLGSNIRLAPTDLAAVIASAPDDVIVDADSGAILVRDENSGI